MTNDQLHARLLVARTGIVICVGIICGMLLERVQNTPCQPGGPATSHPKRVMT